MRTLSVALLGVALIGVAPIGGGAVLPAQSQPLGRPAAPPSPAVAARIAAVPAAAPAPEPARIALVTPLAPSVRRVMPPPPVATTDPADSLYRLARAAVAGGDFDRAAELFRKISSTYRESIYAPDALYWEAYSLFRLGGTENLERARAALDSQVVRFPAAAAEGDAPVLRARITGTLATGGDPRAAAAVVQLATSPMAPPAAPAPRAAPALAAVPTPAAAPSPMLAMMPMAPGRALASAELAREMGGLVAGATTLGLENAALAMTMMGSSPVPPGCPSEGEDERVVALNALFQMDADRAMPILEKVLERRDECSVTLRRRALMIISQQPGPQREEILIRTLRTDPDADVRARAVMLLSQSDDPRVVETLGVLLRDSTDERVQRSALMALGARGTPQANALLREVIRNGTAPRSLRESSILLLGRGESANDVAFLRQFFDSLEDRQLKERLLMTVAQSDGEASTRWLMQVARDQKQPVELRGRALFWLAQGGKMSTSELGSLYSELPEREMREQLIRALAQRQKDPAAVDQLLNIARTEQDRRLRERAIFWLGQSDDPRVAAFLMEIIDR